jgi:hypothetical protein
MRVLVWVALFAVQESLKIKDFSIPMTQTPVETILRMLGDEYKR